jgi:hypothetical protein
MRGTARVPSVTHAMGCRAPSRTRVVAAALLASSGGASAAATPNGGLRQQPGAAGCITETGSGGACADGRDLLGASDLAASADGRFIYAAVPGSDAVVAFSRDAATGALSELMCVSETGSGGRCLETGALALLPGRDGCVGCGKDLYLRTRVDAGPALEGAWTVAVSPDGKFVYGGGAGITGFARDPRGALTRIAGESGCAVPAGSSLTGCMVARGVSARGRMLVAPGRVPGEGRLLLHGVGRRGQRRGSHCRAPHHRSDARCEDPRQAGESCPCASPPPLSASCAGRASCASSPSSPFVGPAAVRLGACGCR